MNADVIRLFEHIKLLQRGVELYQKEKDLRIEGLPNGLNGENIRIGLLGATSAGKTTLIRRLISESAGKVSSRPETACLVVHSFSRSESLSFSFRPVVRFDDEEIGREFTQFLKDFRLSDNYDKKSVREWTLKKDVKEDSREYSREDIFSFFEQVNKFGEVFSKIKWNHKQKRSDYSLTDFIDIYDLPGFGGKDEHNRTVSEIFKKERFDVLVYLIDTSCGIPSRDEMEYLREVQTHIENNPKTMFYWAYEKPSPTPIDFEEMNRQILDAISAAGLNLGLCSKGLLNFIGQDNMEDDNLRSAVLVNILRPYYIKIGRSYRDEAYNAASQEKSSNEVLYKDVFVEDNVWPLMKKILTQMEETEKEKKETGDGLTRSEARQMILRLMIGDDCGVDAYAAVEQPAVRIKSILRKAAGNVFGKRVSDSVFGGKSGGDKNVSDRERALQNVRLQLSKSVDVVLESIFNIDGSLSLTKMPSFKREVYDRSSEIRQLGYQIQFYWMLKDPRGVVGFVKKPIEDSLRDNIDKEVKALDGFGMDDE